MGLLSGLGRLIAGKPVFQAGDKPAGLGSAESRGQLKPDSPTSSADVSSLSTDPPLFDERGRKIIPAIRVSNLVNNRNGSRVTTTAWINNDSDERIRINEVSAAGQRQLLNYDLEPRTGRELKVYDGPLMTDDSRHDGRIRYQLLRSNDLFEALYRLEFYRESDGAYMLEDFHQTGPVRDI